MFEVICDNCGGLLSIDNAATSRSYYKFMESFMTEEGELAEESISAYAIYRCFKCKKIKRLTYKEWELLFRKTITMEVMEAKKRELFAKINPQTIDPDNGLSYCGQCTGYGNDGYCLNDVIKQCTIRK